MEANNKTLLAVGGLVWISYILYKNNQQDKMLKDMAQRLDDVESKAKELTVSTPPEVIQPAPQLTPQNTTPAQKQQLYVDRILGMLPQSSRLSYNSSGNATVSPTPNLVTPQS